MDVPIFLESNGRSETTSEKAWKSGPDSERTRARVRDVKDPALTAAVRKALPVLGFPDLHGACSTVELVTDGGKCVSDTSLMIAAIRPDCAFDAEFGMPCGPDHEEKAKAVAASGNDITKRY
jgi:hypothetical protein